MKHLLRVAFILSIFFLFSCDSQTKEVENLKEETIKIHDEVMPKMSDIMRLKAELKNSLDSADSVQKSKIKELVGELEASDDAMMNWMRNYDPKMEDMTKDEKIKYLNQQKSAIKSVRDQMNSSINTARSFLED